LASARPLEQEGFANRSSSGVLKPAPSTTMRSSLSAIAVTAGARGAHDRNDRDRNDRVSGGSSGGQKDSRSGTAPRRKFYYQKQMQSRTPWWWLLKDGEEIHGVIEWYDKSCIKVKSQRPAIILMIYKPSIKYMYKEAERKG